MYRAAWSLEHVAEQIESIRDTDAAFILPVVPSGHVDHIRYSFAMAAEGGHASEEKSR